MSTYVYLAILRQYITYEARNISLKDWISAKLRAGVTNLIVVILINPYQPSVPDYRSVQVAIPQSPHCEKHS